MGFRGFRLDREWRPRPCSGGRGALGGRGGRHRAGQLPPALRAADALDLPLGAVLELRDAVLARP